MPILTPKSEMADGKRPAQGDGTRWINPGRGYRVSLLPNVAKISMPTARPSKRVGKQIFHLSPTIDLRAFDVCGLLDVAGDSDMKLMHNSRDALWTRERNNTDHMVQQLYLRMSLLVKQSTLVLSSFVTQFTWARLLLTSRKCFYRR